MPDAECIVFEAPDALSANAVLALLREAGIPAGVLPSRRGLPDFYIGTSPLNSWGEVYVEEPHVEKALELIGGFLGTLGMLEEAEPVAGDPAG